MKVDEIVGLGAALQPPAMRPSEGELGTLAETTVQQIVTTVNGSPLWRSPTTTPRPNPVAKCGRQVPPGGITSRLLTRSPVSAAIGPNRVPMEELMPTDRGITVAETDTPRPLVPEVPWLTGTSTSAIDMGVASCTHAFRSLSHDTAPRSLEAANAELVEVT